jgi:hypothetical protein
MHQKIVETYMLQLCYIFVITLSRDAEKGDISKKGVPGLYENRQLFSKKIYLFTCAG